MDFTLPEHLPLRLQLAAVPVMWRGDAAAPLGTIDALLLAWLAVEGPTSRERLAALLWPDSSPEAARNALRQRLFRLRRAAGRELVGGSTTLSLLADVAHDLGATTALLEGVAADASGELDEWLHAQRMQRGQALRQALASRIDQLEAQGDAGAAMPLAEQLLALEPLSEDAHRRIIRLHYLRGDRAAALLAFDRCEAVLKHEVGTRPGSETLALLALLQGAEGDAPRPSRHRLPATLLRPPRLVGRERELQQLREGWLAGSVLLLVGEAGIGKSRLLHAFCAPEPAWIVAAGRPGDDLVPLATLARLLAAVVERVGASLDESIRHALGPLLPLQPMARTPAPRRVRAATLLAPLRSLLHQALRGANPVGGLVLDDLHFADAASIDLLQALLTVPRDEATGMRWCFGLRPPAPGVPTQGLIDALARAGPCVRLSLPPLGEAQLAEWVDSLQLPGAAGARWAPVLRQRSGGNPLFALETLKQAWSQGLLGTSAEPAALPHSTSLQQLIEQQLARLSPGATQLARLAAIAGSDFTLALASQVLQQPALGLADPWHELETEHVLVGTEFAHDLVLDAVLAGVPSVIARHLHAAVAQVLEAAPASSAARAPSARIAAHWEAAGEASRALPHLRDAAAHAHLALREHERIAFLLRAVDIAGERGDLETAFASLADAIKSHMNSIRDAEGYALLDRLDALARTPQQRAEALGHRAWYCMQLADVGGAIRHGEAALALAQQLPTPGPGLVVQHRLATALAAAGRFDEALAHFDAVHAGLAAQRDGGAFSDDDIAELHGNHAAVLDNLGQAKAAATQRRLAMAAAVRAGASAQQVSQLANQAVSHFTAGEVSQAMDSLEQAQRLVASYDMAGSSVGFVAVLCCQGARALGRLAQALAAADLAERELARSNPGRLPVVNLVRGHCWIDLAQSARALQSMRAATALAPHLELRRCLLMSRLEPRSRADWLARAGAALPRRGWPEAALLLEVECAQDAGGVSAVAPLRELIARADDAGLMGAMRTAQLQLFALLADGVASASRAEIDTALQWLAIELGGDMPCATLAYAAELPWQACRLLARAGYADESQALRMRLAAWVREIAAREVDAPFRAGFLERQATNRALLARS